jgi:nucleoside-diphosphate-sugar epimerase
MKILVTGGGGFLGSAVSRQLTQAGHQVIAYQRSAADHLKPVGIEVFQGDICDKSALASAAKGCGAIIHTAGKAGVWGKAADYHRVNVDGTKAVLRVCEELSIPILVHTSSPSIVQGGRDIEGGDESLPLTSKFLAHYPASKAQAELLVLQANSPTLKTTALRPHLIWGPGDPHILPRLAAGVRGGKLKLPGADKHIDTIFVENAALAHVNALDELLGEGKCAGKPYFISNDEPLAQADIICRLLGAIGIKAEVKPVPSWLAHFAGTVCEIIWPIFRPNTEPPVTKFSADQLSTAHWYNITAAKRDMAYQPTISINQGLKILAQSCS